MKKHIRAKPTTHLGTIYRSRLEATWSVFFDFHFLIDSVEYEPYSFKLPVEGWDYTPDFQIKMGVLYNWYLEIKPTMPTEDYIDTLIRFLPHMSSPLLICVGNFFKRNRPMIYKVTRNGLGEKQGLLEVFLEGKDALAAAKQYRFDLPSGDPRPSFRTPTIGGPREHFDRYATEQKKEMILKREAQAEKEIEEALIKHRAKRKQRRKEL